MQIKLKITIKQLPRHYPVPLGQILFKVSFPLYTAERNIVFIMLSLCSDFIGLKETGNSVMVLEDTAT